LTRDMISILHLFRLGSRYCERTTAEVAERLGLDPDEVNAGMKRLRAMGFTESRVTTVPEGKAYFYAISDKGKTFLAQSPAKAGRRLTAVPR
jgi:predicted ArsR family transcriptional regulator